MSGLPGWIAAMTVALVISTLAWLAYGRSTRRAPRIALPRQVAAQEWHALLSERVRLYRRLPPDLQPHLRERLAGFLGRVEFAGCNGLQVTDEMRLVVGAQACILALGLPDDALADPWGISLYPDEFLVDERDEDEDSGVVTEGRRALSGQTLDTDRIVLSWRDVLEAQDRDDGYNVVVHEFAHFMDHAAGLAGSRGHAALTREYEALCAAVDRGEDTLIDPYGAEDPAKFLAVAAEAFLELPRELRDAHPELYSALRELLSLDPAEWPDSP